MTLNFEIVTGKKKGKYDSYTYCNVNNSNEKYIDISTDGTYYLESIVTFKPANIPDAPVMAVDTSNRYVYFCLPRCIDEWEIKYYSRRKQKPTLDDNTYLKNAGVVNLKEYFKDFLSNRWLELQIQFQLN